MRNSRKPISFIATDEPEKARDFFGNVLGLELLETSSFAVVFTDGGHVLRVQIVSDLPTAAHTVHGWQIENIYGEIEALIAKGVHFLQLDQLAQDAHGGWTSPDGHRIAWFHDPSGNILSLTQYANK